MGCWARSRRGSVERVNYLGFWVRLMFRPVCLIGSRRKLEDFLYQGQLGSAVKYYRIDSEECKLTPSVRFSASAPSGSTMSSASPFSFCAFPLSASCSAFINFAASCGTLTFPLSWACQRSFCLHFITPRDSCDSYDASHPRHAHTHNIACLDSRPRIHGGILVKALHKDLPDEGYTSIQPPAPDITKHWRLFQSSFHRCTRAKRACCHADIGPDRSLVRGE
jgi:hypothetical protein